MSNGRQTQNIKMQKIEDFRPFPVINLNLCIWQEVTLIFEIFIHEAWNMTGHDSPIYHAASCSIIIALIAKIARLRLAGIVAKT